MTHQFTEVALSYRKLVFGQPELVFENRPHQFTKSLIEILLQVNIINMYGRLQQKCRAKKRLSVDNFLTLHYASVKSSVVKSDLLCISTGLPFRSLLTTMLT